MSKRTIIEYTERVASEIHTQFAGAPEKELRVWLRLAHQREAMVSELYELSEVDARLGAAPSESVTGVIRSVIASIWAHETSHTQFLRSIRSVSEEWPEFAEVQGTLEGKVTRDAISDGGAFARGLIAVGVSLGRAPAFASDLGRMNIRQLVAFHGELETTARMGYERILELLRSLGQSSATRSELGLTFAYDVARVLSEEKFHEETFRAMTEWVSADGEKFVTTPAVECLELLHNLCERNLSVSAVRRVLDPSALVSKGEELQGWVSDGGLGNLFADHALSFNLVNDMCEQVRPA